jgi:L-fuculose-phosphate aldolase
MKTERESRIELAEICRLMYQKDLISSTDGNVSVKLKNDRLLITPSGIHKGFLKPADVIVTDMQGKKISGSRNASQEILMHIEAYNTRPDINSVIHAHPIYCIAFTLAGLDLGSDFLPEVVLSVGRIPIVPYSTPTSSEVAEKIREYIATYDAMILDRHGSLTVGKTVFDAFNMLERMEHVAKVMCFARQLGPVQHLSPAQLEKLQALLPAN